MTCLYSLPRRMGIPSVSKILPYESSTNHMTADCIALLYNEPVAGSGADDWDVLDQVEAVEKAMDELGIPVLKTGIHQGFMQQILELETRGITSAFNLVEAINNQSALNYFIPAALNLTRIAYSGNPLEALFITSSKRLTCQILRQHGIRVPFSVKPSEHHLLLKNRKYILKPVWEEGSAGITASSVFTYSGELPAALKIESDDRWQIEEYIEGREFNIALLGSNRDPEILPLAEILFRDFGPDRPRIVDYHAKWSPGSFEYENTIRVFPDLSGNPALEQNLRKAAGDAWRCLGMNGYGRVDIRVDAQDTVYVLEANANPCISPDSGFTAAARKAGYPFSSVIHRILQHKNNLHRKTD